MAKQLMSSNQDEIQFEGPDGKVIGLREAWEIYCDGKGIYPASMTESQIATYVDHFSYWAGIRGVYIDVKALTAPLPPKVEQIDITSYKGASKTFEVAKAQTEHEEIKAQRAKDKEAQKAEKAAKAKGKPPVDVRTAVAAANPLAEVPVGVTPPVQQQVLEVPDVTLTKGPNA